MLDHVFLDAIGALRETLEQAFLERLAFEEGFKTDLLLGDVAWETSYGLPGEGLPPRVRADLTLEWPTWAQTSYRSWYIGEPFGEAPRIDVEVRFRVQRLKSRPDPATILAALPDTSPPIGRDDLTRSMPTIEEQLGLGEDNPTEFGIEVSYDGSYELDDERLEDGSTIDEDLAAMGGWIAATLVRLGDLDLDFLPPLP